MPQKLSIIGVEPLESYKPAPKLGIVGYKPLSVISAEPAPAPYKMARPEDFEDPKPQDAGFLSGLWNSVNPIPATKQFASASNESWRAAEQAAGEGDYGGALLWALNASPATQLGHVLIGAGKAQWDQAVKARDMAREGRYSEAAGHLTASVLPMLGPAAANAGEKIGSGQAGEGFGEAVGLVGQVLAPGVAAKVKDVRVNGPFSNPNSVVADAVDWGRSQGVPIDAATASGNNLVRGAQALSEYSIPGSVIGARARQAQARGLATVGEQLAAKGHASPVTPRLAGQGVREGVTGAVRQAAGDANVAYETLRGIEGLPEHAQRIAAQWPEGSAEGAAGSQVFPRNGRFAPGSNPSVDDIFEGALGDARANGFEGSAKELRKAFDEQVRSARSLADEMSTAVDDYGPAALLREIRSYGGIKPFVKDIAKQGEGAARKLNEEFKNVYDVFAGDLYGWRQKGGASVFRNEGLGLDDLVQQIRQDPKWHGIIDSDADLLEALNDIGRSGPAAVGFSDDLEHLLRATGVQRGEKWWSNVSDGSRTVQAPVDLREVKTALKPIYDELMRRYPVAQQEASGGLKAIQNIVNGPDFESLSTVDAGLGAIKSIARSDLPEDPLISQGTAAQAVSALEAAVSDTAARLGPEAAAALKAGRSATVAKYGAGDVLEALRAEPVQAFRQLTAAKDAGIAQLRQVAKQAPQELPKVGRAYLDDLMAQATANGSFEHAARVANEWQRLGAETKGLLFQDAQHVKDLDRFFLLARKMAESPNPSGSALVGSIAGSVPGLFVAPAGTVGYHLGAGAIAKLLHSPAGVKLLTQGLTIPIGHKAAVAAYASRLSRFAQAEGIALQAVPATADTQDESAGLWAGRR